MANPKLNESMVLALLEAPLAEEGAAHFQTGSTLSIIDGFDRQIVREEFIELCNAAMGLYGSMGRLDTVTAMLHMLKHGKLTEENLQKAVEGLTHTADYHRKALVAKMSLVAQCPLDSDSKH